MPQFTAAQRHKANRDPINDAHIILLEFQEDSRTAINYAAINNENIMHNSQTYIASNISFSLPGSGHQAPMVKMEMSNLSRIIGKAINRAKNRIGCRIKLIDAAAAETSIIDTQNLFVLNSASGDSVKISADLGTRASMQEPVPSHRTTKNTLPGVWWAR